MECQRIEVLFLLALLQYKLLLVLPRNMLPAEVKKRENIAEYIIHMYQTEDLILSYDFNLDEIFEFVIRHMSKDETELKQLLLWYADIIDRMKQEQVVETKERLRETQSYVGQLTDLHFMLYKKDDAYKAIFDQASEDIRNQLVLSEGKLSNPVQICINGVYGMLLIKLNGKKISPEQQSMIEHFGEVLSYLSKAYRKSN